MMSFIVCQSWELLGKTTNKISTLHPPNFPKSQATKSLFIDALSSVFLLKHILLGHCRLQTYKPPPQFSVKSISVIYCHLLEDHHGCPSKCDQNVRGTATHRSQHGEGTGIDDGSCPLQVCRTEPTARPARYWSFQLGESVQREIFVSYILAWRKFRWLGCFSISSSFYLTLGSWSNMVARWLLYFSVCVLYSLWTSAFLWMIKWCSNLWSVMIRNVFFGNVYFIASHIYVCNRMKLLYLTSCKQKPLVSNGEPFSLYLFITGRPTVVPLLRFMQMMSICTTGIKGCLPSQHSVKCRSNR